jgi:glyoxylase-like metal-dependent hydrolase (beta-lactamase superfamily II)
VSGVTVHRAEHPLYLSNAYLVVDDDGRGVLIDGHGEAQELIDLVDREGIEIQAILLTHHHGDHVQIGEYERFDVPVLASAKAAELIGGDVVDRVLADGETVEFGALRIEAIPTPGHSAGHLALRVNADDVFTADVLFKGTVGGSRAPGNTGFDDLRASVMRLMELPPETRVHPGHREPTTIGEERENNVFVRAFRGQEPELGEPVRVAGRDAELLIWGPDYDGTNKAWVRFPDGSQDITGGSQVERE